MEMGQNSDDEQTRDQGHNTCDATTETIKPVLRLFCMITLIFTRNHWASKLHKNGNGTLHPSASDKFALRLI